MMRFTTLGRLLVYLTATAMAAGLQLAWADGTWQQGSGLSGLSGAASGSVAGDAAGNLYVATDVGIYKSSDAGASWSAAFDGLSG
ncbi:hypothetical protein, partial [Chitinimonas sp.]|uniref:hypothetical protein n=1 Tax=Chitinimonas sp. TaxID=1934313 RepID=UPI0035AE2D95